MKSIKFRNYTREQGFTRDYHDVLDFMKSLGCNDVHSLNLSWVRWGAMRCVVGSNQDFYFHLGFAPYDMRTY